jgi:hypothetical protein
MMEKIVHTAKQTVKATVESHKARRWSAAATVETPFMEHNPVLVTLGTSTGRINAAIGRPPALIAINRTFGVSEGGVLPVAGGKERRDRTEVGRLGVVFGLHQPALASPR